MTASQHSKSSSLGKDPITGAHGPDLLRLGTLHKNKEIEVELDADPLSVINNIYRKYCGSNVSEEELNTWLTFVLTSFINNNSNITRSMQYYRDARITFCESQGKLHLEKNSKTSTLLPAGESLSSEIRLSHVFMRKFGVDTTHVKEGRVFYDEEDMQLFTDSVKSDIDAWCDVVHFVTNI